MAVAKLKESPVIWTLAKDLKIKKISDPVNDILGYCEQKVRSFLKEFPDCVTLSDLLDIVAAKLETVFLEVRSDDELKHLQQSFVNKGEKIFANLETELGNEVFGITFKLANREPWEHEFVSVIDCRGDKGLRSYFTKWHEISHLLVLTNQQRLKFMRTIHKAAEHNPEEAMIDIIAGKFGFYQPFIKKHAHGNCDDISFEIIEDLRAELCSESSCQASLIGFVQAWPDPCILVNCELALKKSEQASLIQPSFGFITPPTPLLRATKVTLNRSAKDSSFRIYRNMRVPESSVINDVHEGHTDYAEAEENLSWWESSDGKNLQNIKIFTKVKRFGNSIYSLIAPI